MKFQTQLARLVAEVERRGALVDEVIPAAHRLSFNLTYPRLFADLLMHHSFTAFEIGSVRVYSNIPSEEDNLRDLLADEVLTRALVDAGFLPFGQPGAGDYDRVCFDMQKTKKPLDAPVVRVNHESILSHHRIPRPQKLAPGIMDLLSEADPSRVVR